MRIAALLPRYHSDIVGGADEYLRQLLRGLHDRGVEIEVLTTRDTHVRAEGTHALLWGNVLDGRQGEQGDVFPVRRYWTATLPPGVRRRWSRTVDAARARAQALTPLDVQTSHLSFGFHGLEMWAGQFPFRWTASQARIELRGSRVDGIELELSSVQPIDVVISVEGRVCGRWPVPAHEWTAVSASFTPTDRAGVLVQVSPTFEPAGDPRTLGAAVRRVTVTSSAGRVDLPLERDRHGLLDTVPTVELADHLDREVQAWPRLPALLDGLLKGPLSPGLVVAAARAARRSDLVLATNAPFMMMNLGLLAGRLARRPVVMLPFLHLRDSYHHRPSLRHALSEADRVLCLNRTTCTFIESRWRATARFIGGGIDPVEYGQAIDGPAFRARHGLEGVPIVLTVARKTPSKGYRMACDAVEALRRQGIACQHVLIGPDEDGLPIDQDGSRYLGRQPRGEVLAALAACDVFTLPSVYESFGLAYLEAWMLGKPVIGHALCDPARELIDDGGDGLLVADTGQLVDALRALLTDPSRRQALGDNGREKTLRQYTWPHVVERALDALSEVVAA